MVRKVTSPSKKVTDTALLGALAKQGIDRDYVEFYQDYTRTNPFAKFYRDLKSNKCFMVVSELPMVDGDGEKVEVGWEYAGGRFIEKNNLFKITVQGTHVEIKLKNDQPGGSKKNDRLSYQAQVFLNGEGLSVPNPELPEIDPVNPNYRNNVLEWDYGICRRRLRLIEGRVLGSWVFPSNPSGDVRIKYNQSGNFKLRLGEYGVGEDEEIITAPVFNGAEYPFTVSDSLTVYPDADPEISTVDGNAYHQSADSSWSAIRDGAGIGAFDDASYGHVTQITADGPENTWNNIYRGIFLFDTSSLGEGATISAATLSLYGKDVYESPWALTLNIYTSNPSSNTALASGDFDSLGTTALCGTGIASGSWNTSGYNDFAFNASGLAAINKTGISKFGSRDATYDATDSPPTWQSDGRSYIRAYFAEQGSGYKPKLVITYETGGATEKESSDSGTGTDTKASFPAAVLEGAESGSGTDTKGSFPAAALVKSESGSGVETAGINATLASSDAGTGADNSVSDEEEFQFGNDNGSGSDAMKVLVTRAVSGSEMNLPGSGGRVRMPSKGVDL